MTAEYHIDEMPRMVGRLLGTSEWLTIRQSDIDAFAEVTGDRQWIHTDRVRAASGPFGTTIAHGYFVLSLLPLLVSTAYRTVGASLVVNYGLNRLRFTAPVPAGSRVRLRATLDRFEQVGDAWQSTITATIMLAGSQKPACVADVVTRLVPERPL